MMKLSVIVLAVLMASTLFAQDDGWEPLFNGKDLNNWEVLNGSATYRIEGDMIIGTTRTKTRNTFLATNESYSDFILELELKADPALNSGIQIRSLSDPDIMNGTVHGYQVEVDPSKRAWSGGIYDESRRGWLYPLSRNPEGQVAYNVAGWNKYHIEAIGNTVRVWINGINTANLVDDMTAEGFIALQVHGIGKNEENAGKEIAWRNLRIRTTDLEQSRWTMDPDVEEWNYVANSLTEWEKRKGWRLLWDGETSSGWRSARSEEFPERGWTIHDGILEVAASGGAESAGAGDIITKDKFGEFELKVEFMLTKGANSGIKYFVDPELNKGSGSAIGLEFQILDDRNHPDAEAGVKGNRKLGSLYDLIPAENLSVPWLDKVWRGPGQWNQAHIIVNGNKIEHWLNGHLVVKYERNTPMFRALVAYSKYKVWPNFGEADEGHLLLQEHGDNVKFRSIKIREY